MGGRAGGGRQQSRRSQCYEKSIDCRLLDTGYTEEETTVTAVRALMRAEIVPEAPTFFCEWFLKLREQIEKCQHGGHFSSRDIATIFVLERVADYSAEKFLAED